MANAVSIIGVDPTELSPVRLLIALLRHPDPAVGELARHSLTYLQEVAATRGLAFAPESTSPATVSAART